MTIYEYDESEKNDMSVIDKAEWQYNSALETFCELKKCNKDELSDEAIRTVWNYASNHITIFVTWLAINHFLSDDHYNDEEAKFIQDLKQRKVTGFDYFEKYFDLILTSDDIRDDVLANVTMYYENQYTKSYCEYVNALETPFKWEDYDKVASVISSETSLLNNNAERLCEKPDKRVMNLIYGRNLLREVSVGILLILSFGAVGIMLVGSYFIYQEDGAAGLIFLIPCLIIIAFVVLMSGSMISEQKRRKNALKSKYEHLSSEDKNKVYNMAKKYKGSNARCNDQYVYGQFSLVKRAKEKLRKEVAFEYIPLTEIVWIHLLKTSIALPTGGSIGDVLVTETRNLVQSEICIYTYDGQCYKGFGNEELLQKIKEIVKVINPGCKVGYSKELEEEFFSRYKMFRKK